MAKRRAYRSTAVKQVVLRRNPSTNESAEPEFLRIQLQRAVPRPGPCLIKRVYEVEPLPCPRCGTEMKIVAFIDPPQGDVIEKILRRHPLE